MADIEIGDKVRINGQGNIRISGLKTFTVEQKKGALPNQLPYWALRSEDTGELVIVDHDIVMIVIL